MIKTSIEKLANDIGFDIGNSDDIVQADLLNGFGRAFKYYKDKASFERQLLAIADKLDRDSDHLITELAAFIKLKNEEKDGK